MLVDKRWKKSEEVLGTLQLCRVFLAPVPLILSSVRACFPPVLVLEFSGLPWICFHDEQGLILSSLVGAGTSFTQPDTGYRIPAVVPDFLFASIINRSTIKAHQNKAPHDVEEGR
jgi:hypothetical protein